MSYLMYLRKSRADKEAEARGEGETLARHEQILSELAAKMDLPIGATYKEIVSGETISSRPKMQQLLIEVMQGHWEGVLVMEIERLARGDTKDQGTVAEAFKFSNTKIITPIKTYDPLNEYDEEYFEFNLFMSRREYKTINRRIQRGRIACLQALALQFWRDGTENSHIIKCAKAGMQAVAALDHGELGVGLPHQIRRIGALMTVVFAV